MQRIPQVDPKNAPAGIAATFDAVKGKIGMVPNIFKTMANAPVVLNGYLAFSNALGGGRLSPALREQIALVTANLNGCDYCASAHTAAGKMAGLTADEIARNMAGSASDPKAAAAVNFAKRIVEERGFVSDADLSAVRAAGFTNEEVVEIVANVATNLFTNYFNHIAETDIDFPKVETDRLAA